jgi:hypothetical protein
MGLTTSVINKLILARHLFAMASDNLKSHREIALFATVNLMQDAVEAFLLGVSEHINAGISSGTTFERYFEKIDERIAPKTLSFRSRLIALNKVRVAAKHHGVKPDRKELEDFAVVCREFFNESCNSIMGVPFWSISLIDLLDEDESKQLLAAAQVAFDGARYLECLIACRKVLFIEFERRFDVAKFRDTEPSPLLSAFSSAPFYARSQNYVRDFVETPFDYIVFDHQRLDGELMAQGIDTQIFWNIWRLTPSVYRFEEYGKPKGEWLIKREMEKEAKATEEQASYVLENIIDITIRIRQRASLLRYHGPSFYYIRLKHEGVSVYKRADRNSPISKVTEAGLRKVNVDYATPGLDGDGTYWRVSHYGDAQTPQTDSFYGFIHEDDVDWPSEGQGTA